MYIIGMSCLVLSCPVLSQALAYLLGCSEHTYATQPRRAETSGRGGKFSGNGIFIGEKVQYLRVQ